MRFMKAVTGYIDKMYWFYWNVSHSENMSDNQLLQQPSPLWISASQEH